MKEEYGFVYIWRDKKRKMFYIGCHWGHEDDGYICSSSWMMKSYKRRPEDFKKRKILARIYTNRKDLLEEEYKWLSMIKLDELKVRYYNLHNHHFGHWSNNENSLSIKEKISIAGKKRFENPKEREKTSKASKERMAKIENRQKLSETIKKLYRDDSIYRERNKKTEEGRQRLSEKMKGNTNGIGNKSKTGQRLSEEQKKNSKIWKIITPDGNEVMIHNLAKYCRDNNLHDGHIATKGYKGYFAVKVGEV